MAGKKKCDFTQRTENYKVQIEETVNLQSCRAQIIETKMSRSQGFLL